MARRILLVGASGFIGRHLLRALSAGGHSLVATSRSGTGPQLPGVVWQPLDLERLAEKPELFPWPDGIDLVINAAGVLDSDLARQARVQADGACALFDLAARHGAAVLQLSALGAGDCEVPFLASKARADAHLLALGSPAVVLRPSLVLGEGGASSAWLERLAPLPLAPLLDTRARSMPLHVDDLVGAVLALLRRWPEQPQVLELVGPEALTQGELLDRLRAGLGWGPARYLQLPGALAGVAARLHLLDPQLLELAQRDNLGDAAPLEQLGGYRPARLDQRLDSTWPQKARAVNGWLHPSMIIVLALIWLGTALVCLGPGFDWGLRIMAEMGVHGLLAKLAVVGGALLDGLLGIGLLLRRWRRHALLAQLGLMLAYTLLISLLLPHYWADPYAAVGKNLVLMVATLWVLWLEPSQRKTG
ncbi:SDR family oxidoreductase [Pseudomonas sp. TUM22785]|uniref:SDR family oxidoreductase n=1 Tax=Pseudomonas sp. TUM22785 TaxID=3019098 RepID=UPI0023054866|nr:SDR family oxidoreductase [Pseudomonas sp. TUM22785]WCD80775.1 SDR family oxidoreductase [Pseudomonas sp. TUM22785]